MSYMNGTGRAHAASRGSMLFLIIGWISAIISLARFPFIFGVLGVIMGILASRRGSRAGVGLIMVSIILMSVGLIFNGVIFNYLRHFLGI